MDTAHSTPDGCLPPEASPANFDRVARLYRWAEYLAMGPLLQQTRKALLHRIGLCRKALLFGDGDGRFTARMLARHTAMHATAVDTSEAMLRLLRRRAEQAGVSQRLQTNCGSALRASICPGTDLVVTHFFLDCLQQTELDLLVSRVAAAVHPGTLWLLSEFGLPRRPVLRSMACLYIRGLYLAFRLLTGLRVQRLPDPQAALAAHGFRRLERRERLFGLLYSELWQLAPADERNRHNPAFAGAIHTPMQHVTDDAPATMQEAPVDPLPDPEPPVPALPEPDPGVFHHPIAVPQGNSKTRSVPA